MLAGLVLGIILDFVFPQLLDFEFESEVALKQKFGTPIYPPTIKSGSIFAVGGLAPVLCAMLGGVVGLIAYKIKIRMNKK